VTEVEFRLLGAMQLRVDDEPATLPGAAERCLLALLLLSPGRTVAASSLIDRLWSESALPADPLNALQLQVSKLRRALAAHGVDVIVREASGYRADVDLDPVDLRRFVTMLQAVRLLRLELRRTWRSPSSSRLSSRRCVHNLRGVVGAGEHGQDVGDGHRAAEYHRAGLRVGHDRLDAHDVTEPAGHLAHTVPALL
jgi:hypothetical protein